MKKLLMGMMILTAFSAMADGEYNSKTIQRELYAQVSKAQISCVRHDGVTSSKLNEVIKLHLMQYLGAPEIPVRVNVDLSQPAITSFQVLDNAEIQTKYTTNAEFTKLEQVEVIHTSLIKTSVNEGTIIKPRYVVKVDRQLLYEVMCDVK